MTIKNKKFNLIKSRLGQGAVLISSLALPAIITTETKAMMNRPPRNQPIVDLQNRIASRPPLASSIYGTMLREGVQTLRPVLLPSTQPTLTPETTTPRVTITQNPGPEGGIIVNQTRSYVEYRNGLRMITTENTTDIYPTGIKPSSLPRRSLLGATMFDPNRTDD